MAYEVIMPYHLHMPSYFLETFTEYPYLFLENFFATTQTLYLCLSWKEEIWECRNENSKRAMSKLNRAIPSSAVGAGSARIHKANCFRAGEPRPYELNDSIIRGLTQLLFFILYQGIYTDYSPLIAATPGRTFPSIASSKAPPPVEM